MKYIKPLNEARPMFQDTPNEFAYLDFKKWAYKNRGKIKKELDDFDLILSPAMGGIIVGYELGKLLNKETIF